MIIDNLGLQFLDYDLISVDFPYKMFNSLIKNKIYTIK